MSVIIASASLTAIAPYMIDFSRAAAAAAELFKLMDRVSQIDSFSQAGLTPDTIEGNIAFNQVSFAYPMRPGMTVLQDFSLNIPAGKVTALVGASGSGKSTIIGLLERWYNAGSGQISLDGRPIESLNVQWLRKHVRLVQQEPVLFSGSVFDNIAKGLVGTPWETSARSEQMAEVKEAAEVAFAHTFIEALPQGYDTVIGERGGLLSGGQKQRVAIARSIISQPRVLLLDEATSALDPHAEEIVQQALDNVSKDRTTITIAHKLATIRNADNIVVMDKGAIVEQGSHRSLIAAGGAYARLVKAQDLSVEPGLDEKDELDTDDDQVRDKGQALELARSLTRTSTVNQQPPVSEQDRDDYDKWKRVGLVRTIFTILKRSPELRGTYFILMLCCFAAGKYFKRYLRLQDR